MTIKTTSKFSILTIVKYDTYQGSDVDDDTQKDKRPTRKRQATDTQATLIEERKEEEEEKELSTHKKKRSKKIMSSEDFIAEGKTPVKLPDGTISQKVFLTTDQKEKLVLAFKKQFGLDCFGEYLQLAIQKLDNYITNHKKGREYVDHYKVILDWPLEKAIQKFNLDQQQKGHNERRLRNS